MLRADEMKRPTKPGSRPARTEVPLGPRDRTGDVDVRALERRLRRTVEGEVRFDAGARALYATDSSNYRQVPLGLVVPRSVDDVVATVAACREHDAPVLSRGGGTSLAGQCCNVAVVMDFSKYLHRVLEVDAGRSRARVQPGCVLDDLRNQAKRSDLTFGPDPATHDHCTLGGMLGNNSCGMHAQMAGKTSENVDTLDILTYRGLRLRVGPTSEEELRRIIDAGGERGELYRKLRDLRDRTADLVRARFPHIPRRVSGYNLDDLLPEHGFNLAAALVGSEGTLVTILEASLKLVPARPRRTLVVLGYRDAIDAADHLEDVLPFDPIALEALDSRLIEQIKDKHLQADGLKLLPKGGGFLMVEFGADRQQDALDQAHRLMDALKKKSGAPSMKLLEHSEEGEGERIWKVREAGLGATAFPRNERDTWEGWEDSAVPPARMGEYLRKLRALLDRHGYDGAFYGHFGQGCLHTRIDFDLYTEPGIAKWRAFLDESADLCTSLGGSLSGEHGDGQSKAALLPKMFGEEIVQAFREFKTIWDPDWKMNPGKVVDPFPITTNLRLGPSYAPPEVKTWFHYPNEGSFQRATLHCVGVGKCRREGGGVMCPSYQVTREEMHSTRGRAHLLFEMLNGAELKDGWRDTHVREALDLCLACKGCKHDCPLNVDMATYKAEFLAHHYRGRLRPRHAYAMGLIAWWARAASLAPRLVNWISHAPGLSALVKWAGGIAQERTVPRFAPRTFRAGFVERPLARADQPRVLLWPDTFNDHFHPEVAHAGVEVLEAAGFHVELPPAGLCCGRPLYDFGMLDTARRLLSGVLEALRPRVRAGISIVGLEPSCVAVFRDELCALFPDDEDAKRLRDQTFLLSEFLVKHGGALELVPLRKQAIVQGHCHHRSVLDFDAEETVLGRLGLEVKTPEPGCCGMAGSFGFEADHVGVSKAIGEKALLPAVRSADDDTLVIADGFSCREQIQQGSPRKALHLAEVLRLALAHPPVPAPRRRFRIGPARVALLGLTVLAVAGAGILWRSRR
jgi:FAD/FMN-containing dehydrogenase/Fe-S oxidoreductase